MAGSSRKLHTSALLVVTASATLIGCAEDTTYSDYYSPSYTYQPPEPTWVSTSNEFLRYQVNKQYGYVDLENTGLKALTVTLKVTHDGSTQTFEESLRGKGFARVQYGSYKEFPTTPSVTIVNISEQLLE